MTAPINVDVSDTRSLQIAVAKWLRNAIITHEYKPGERLPLDLIAQRLNVSHTPVRHAVAVLETEGFAEVIAHRGARVAGLTKVDLEIIQSVREGIECRLAQLGAEAADEGIEANVRQLGQIVIAKTKRRDDIQSIMAANWQLRDAYYACACREELHALAKFWRSRIERYLYGFPSTVHQMTNTHLDDFDRLFEAVATHDGKAAAEVTRNFLQRTLATLSREIDK